MRQYKILWAVLELWATVQRYTLVRKRCRQASICASITTHARTSGRPAGTRVYLAVSGGDKEADDTAKARLDAEPVTDVNDLQRYLQEPLDGAKSKRHASCLKQYIIKQCMLCLFVCIMFQKTALRVRHVSSCCSICPAEAS
jgi:hypothetical protein